MPPWHRLAIVAVVLLLTAILAQLVDRRLRSRSLPPAVATRYRVLRRSVVATIVFVGILSALLVIPQVRAVAGGLLASSAVLGIVIGFASQRTIGNFVAGLLIAFTQPIRLGDRIEVDGVPGTVEEIALTYTFIRTDDRARFVIPNEKLASDTIRNWTIVSREKVAEITLHVPIDKDLRAVVDLLRETVAGEREANVAVTALNGDATLLGSIPAEKNRQPVPLSRMSPWLSKATVAIEDRRFYKHGGVDYKGILRAAVKDLRAGRVVQGGSTITQQLVRNLYISRQRTFNRKIKEACLAIKLARHRSKDWILNQYMNAVYYGNHAYGIEAAAQTYFSRRASTLTLDQSALLAGLPQAPSVYDPIHRPLDALERRDEVLPAKLENRALPR